MRRVVAIVLAVASTLVFAAPAGALTRVPFEGAARAYRLVGVCPFTIDAQERAGHPGYLVYDGKDTIVGVRYEGAFDTVLSSSLGVLSYESEGSTTVFANRNGTWTQIQRGLNLVVVPASDRLGPRLLWFTGTVVSVGSFDPKTLDFVPRWQLRWGYSGNICDQLVTGLKSRHDT